MPKKDGGGVSKKTIQKHKEKVIEDKTFGLKNKNKSKAVQNYIKSVETQVKGSGKSRQAELDQAYREKAEKKKQREEEAFLASLTNSVKTVKQAEVEEDEKMKNVLCEYFKQGNCPDGDKCKFAHDLNIEFNQGQVDIYTDLREAKAKLGIDYELMEQREAKRSKLPKTEIVCKFFLDAVKKKVYGYKWNCPNGDDCHYRHCLPKDYVIKTLKAQTEEEMTIEEFHDLEEKIDAERARLEENGTKVTEKTFQEWKEKKLKEKEKENNLTKDKKSELLKKLKTFYLG